MEQDQGQDQGQGQAPGEYSLGDLYGEASRRGWFKEPGDLQQMAHELRARGLIVDPTQGGLVNPNAPPPAAPAPPVNPNAPAPYMQVPPRVAAHPAGAPPVLPPVPPGFSAPAPVTPQPRPVHGSFDARFNTILSPADERHFQTWKQQYAPHDSGDDYDLRGAFSAGLRPNAQTGHWPDRFKKPNHPTFSNESQYALYGRPGHWQGETFIPPSRLAQAPVQRPPQFLQDVAPSGKRRIAPIGFIKSPDETTIKQQNAELDQIGKQFGPGHHYAEGGPVDLKKRAAAETTAQLGGSLPALWQDWTTRARALRQAEDQTIAAIKRWSQGKLSPADAAQARQDWHDLEQNRQILMARAERLRAYAGMAGQTARQYNGQAIHNGPLLPQEAPGRQGSGAWDIAKGTVAGTVGSIAGPAFQKFEGTPVGGWLVRNIEGLKPGVIDAYTQALPQARQQVMLEGKYPALPANPGKNPAEQAALDEQTKQLRRMFFTDVPGIGLMPSGAVGSAAWRQQIHQMPLTPWQQKLVPIFESQVAAEREASERAKLGQSALTDAASFALAEFGGKLIGKPVAKFLGRFAEPLEQRLMASGAPILVKNAAKFGLRAGVNTLSHGAGAAATGAVAGPALLAAEDLQQQAAGGRGSSPADYARAAGQGAANIGGIGAVMGAAGHLLHPRATVHAAPSEAYHTALPAPKIKPDLIDLPDGRQVDLNHTTRSELETINNFLPGDHPARAKIEQKLWGPKSEPVGAAKVADPHGAAVSARSLTPEEITNVLQDFTMAEQQAPLTPEQQQNKTAVEAQAAAIEAHKEAQNLPVPPEAQGDEQAAFTKSKVLGQTHYNAVKGVAESVRAENPDLAAKLDTAAARMRAESRADFREDYHVESGAYPERATAVPPPQHSTWRDLTDAERATLPENIRRILLIQDARNSGQVLHPELAAREFTKGYERRATAWLARTADDLYHSAEAKYGDGKPQAIAAPPAPAGAAVPTAGVAPAAPTIGITPPAGQVEAAGTATPRPGSAFGGPAPAWEVGRERPIEPARPGEAPDANAPFPLNVRGEGVSPHETPLEQAARFVVDTGKTTEFDLQRKFNLSFEDAEDLLHGLRERGVIGNKGEGGLSPVIARREQLDGLFAADRRRRAVEMAGGQPIAYPPALAEPAKRTLIEPAPKPERPTGPLDHVAPGEFGAPATEGRIERGGGPRRVDLGDLRTEAQRAAGGEGQPVGRMLTNKEKGARLIPKGEGGPERIPVPEAGAESKPAYPGPERRVNPAERKLVEEMTPEEKDRALLHDEMSGLGNTRAWNETEQRGTRKAHVADIDADGLGAINKHYGEVGGDALIGAVGDALRKAGLGDNAFRRGGDEFRAHADSPEDLQRRLDAARQILEETPISFTDNNGETRTLKGASLSYGIAETETKANIALKADKAGRRKLGLRARRKESLPPRLVEVGRGGGPVSERNAAPVRARAGRASEGNPEGARPGVAAPKKKLGLKKQASETQAHPIHPEVAPGAKHDLDFSGAMRLGPGGMTLRFAEDLLQRLEQGKKPAVRAPLEDAVAARHAQQPFRSAEELAQFVRDFDASRVALKEQQQKPQLAPDVLAKRQALQREQEAAARAKQGAPKGEDVFGRPQVLPADTPAKEQSDFQAFGASYAPEVVDRLPAMPQGEGWHAMQHQQQLVGPPPGPNVPPPTPNPQRSFGPPQGEVSKAVQNLPIDPEVKGQFLARHGDPNARSPELWSAIREKFAGIGDGLKQFHQEMVRVFPDLPNDQQHTELIQKFLRRQAGDAIAYSRVHRDIHQALHGLSHGERQILELQRYVNDMVATAAKQRDTWVKSGKDPLQFKSLLPDGLTEAQAAQAKQQIEAYLKQGAKADGIDAAKIAAAHDKIVDYRKKVVDRFVDLYQQVNGVKLDLDPDTYFRHNLLYLSAAEETLGTGGGKGIHTRASRSWLKSRTGSELPYNTNFVESELSWVPEMIKDTLDLEILHHVQQTYDLSPSVKLAQAELGNKGMIDFMQAIDGGKTPAADQIPALMKLAAEGRLPDRLNGEFRSLLDSLSYLHRKNLELKAQGKPLHGLSPEMTTALKSYAGFMLDQDKHGQVKIRSIVEDPRWLARNGYKEYQAREGRHFFRAMSVPERLMNDAAGAVLNQIVLGKEDLRSVLAVGAERRKMILPAHVADALERFGAPGSDYQTRLQKGARWLQAAWKWDKLYNPVHAPIYWTNNLKSDMVAIARGNPRALTYIPKAAVEIARALRGKMISPELNRWIDKGGLASTFIRREGLGEGAGVDLLRKYYTHQEPRWVRVKQAYKNVMELPHEWREATGRYATYLAFLDDLKTNGGMPKRYGASIPALVDGLSDLHDKAWKLSNDLVGAYNEVSPVGQNLRRFVFPFWSWQEVSFKREMRLLRNAINSPEVARGMGKQLNGVQATGVRLLALSRYLAGAAMVGAAAEGWNRMWYGADYRKKLPKELRESFVPVWILRSDPKSGQLLYHRFPGDFVETLDWLGINGGYHYLQDYMNRKMTGWEIAKDFAGDSARALANHVYQQSSFAFKAEQELIGGQTGFPDATDPRRVDKLEAFFREASLDKSYRMLRGIPLPKPAKVKLFGKEIGGRLPLKAGPWLAGMDVIHTLLNVSAANVEENNYFDVKADAGQWKRQKNGGGGTPAADRDAKASAAYYFRLSMRYGDIDSAERFLWDFHRYGGTDQAMQQSLQDMEPLHGLKLSEQSRFLEQADGEEKERVRRAYLHWANLVAPEYDASWFSKAALDSQAIMQIRAQVGGALKATWAQRTDAGMSLDPVIAKIQGLTPADRSTYLGRMNGDGAAKVRERYRVLAGRAAPGVKPPPDSMPLPEWVERLQAAIAQATGTQAQEQIQEQGYRGQ
jgi:GGDEF domain-containing protein